MLGILGKKTRMTQVFKDDGICIPITVINAGPCVVVQVKSKDNDGYCAVQLGYQDKRPKRTNKPQAGHFKKNNISPKQYTKEIRISQNEKIEIGQTVAVDIFKEGDFVDVTGMSIGKGFQGGMKRWGWSGGPESHGSMSHRRIGSAGANTSPGRIVKGHPMPGHMGNSKVTVQNLEVIKVDKENNTLLVKGAVPGHKGTLLIIRKAKKK
ncbi:MAG: 50S ribosomal protein L3 [Candidatus Omnitrophica bacterium]|nr:50S ribosomal protein L3 [Candidatus Omnitrophota bacterium]